MELWSCGVVDLYICGSGDVGIYGVVELYNDVCVKLYMCGVV